MKNIPIVALAIEEEENAKKLAEELNSEFYTDLSRINEECLYLRYDLEGLKLVCGDKCLTNDFSSMKNRLKAGNLQQEMIIKAVRIKKHEGILNVLDATAGMGEDSLILAAAGFNISMCEYNPIISALLSDSLKRAREDELLADLVKRMELLKCDSIEYMNKLKKAPDVILLDPMFPERNKSALIKKKFQLLQRIESPCGDEARLLEAAINAKPKKIVIKRPLKGEYLANKKPDFSYSGKAIRYDCILC